MNKKLLLIALIVGISHTSDRNQNQQRIVTIGPKTADIAEHICDYFLACELFESSKKSISMSVEKNNTSEIFSLVSSKKTTKNPISPQKLPLLDYIKLHSFITTPKKGGHRIAQIKSKSEFIQEYAPLLRKNEFKLYDVDNNNHKETHIFIGNGAQEQAVQYYFAQKICKLRGFYAPTYYPLNEVNNENNGMPSLNHRLDERDEAMHLVFNYLYAMKRKLLQEKLNAAQEKIIKETELIEYVKNEERSEFVHLSTDLAISNKRSFGPQDLDFLLQGKFCMYKSHINEEIPTEFKSFAYIKERMIRIFIGNYVDALTPHDYYIHALSKS